MIYLLTTYLVILALIVEFNKQLIDNVESDEKEQKEWHIAQFFMWCGIYLAITFSPAYFCEIDFWNHAKMLILFGGFFPTVYDFLLNIRRGLPLFHKGEHDLSWWLKISFLIIAIIIQWTV